MSSAEKCECDGIVLDHPTDKAKMSEVKNALIVLDDFEFGVNVAFSGLYDVTTGSVGECDKKRLRLWLVAHKLPNPFFRKELVQQLKLAASALRQILHHPNILPFLQSLSISEADEEDGEEALVGLVYDAFDESLFSNMRHGSEKTGKSPTVRGIRPKNMSALADVCAGMMVLHAETPPMLHGDLGPSYVVRLGDGPWRIIGYGLLELNEAICFSSGRSRCGRRALNIAPEVQNCGLHTAQSDVFAFGVLSLQALSGELLPACSQLTRCDVLLQLGTISGITPALLALLQRTVSDVPADRPTFVELCGAFNQDLGRE